MTEDKASVSTTPPRRFLTSEADRLRQIEFNLERERCIKELKQIWGAQHCSGEYPRFRIDHSNSFRIKGIRRSFFIMDNSYAPAVEPVDGLGTIAGWRVLDLPPSMSFYVAEYCAPRLLAPPDSKVDLLHLRKLLITAGFIGNYVRTLQWRETHR